MIEKFNIKVKCETDSSVDAIARQRDTTLSNAERAEQVGTSAGILLAMHARHWLEAVKRFPTKNEGFQRAEISDNSLRSVAKYARARNLGDQKMHDFRAAICGLILSVSAGAALAQQAGSPPPLPMTLTSTSFVDGGVLPDKSTAASAKPVSPELSWDNAPAATVSFALMVHDLDAATDKTSEDHLHWGIFNIPANVHSLAEGQPNVPQLPDGSIQIKSSAPAMVGFRGPGFPGISYHHYAFELYALDTKLPLGQDATRDDVLKAMNGHIISQAADVALAHTHHS